MTGGRQGTPGFDPRRLRRLRVEAGWTQAALGAAAGGIPRHAIAQWETGRRVPEVSSVAALARALGADPLELVDRSEGEDLTIGQLRVNAGLSQQVAGERAGLLRTTYSAIERGERIGLSEEEVAALAAVFGVDVADVRTAHAASRSRYLDRRAGSDR